MTRFKPGRPPLRISPRAETLAFRWTSGAGGGEGAIESGWESLVEAATAPSGRSPWSPFVVEGKDRFLSALVIDGCEGEDEAGLARVRGLLESIHLAAYLSWERPEAGVLWRVALPLSTSVRLGRGGAAGWLRACWLLERWLTQKAGLEPRTPVEEPPFKIHAAPELPFASAASAARSGEGRRAVNLEGMVGDRGSGGIGTLRVEDGDDGLVLYIGPVGYHLSPEEAADLAVDLWAHAPAGRPWPCDDEPDEA